MTPKSAGRNAWSTTLLQTPPNSALATSAEGHADAGRIEDSVTVRKPLAPPRAFTVADTHALAGRLERNGRPQSDQVTGAKFVRAFLTGHMVGEVIVLQDD